MSYKTIAIGNTIKVLLGTGKLLAITIKTPQEINLEGLIVSYESPIAKALLGKSEGDYFSYVVEGRTTTGRIMQVD